jgi:group II intron reverse transcriptase/maturase
MIFSKEHKSQPITKLQVNEAFKKVKANKGSAGVDGITIEMVSDKPRKYLYPLWNRMTSGSYFPKTVRQVLIPKGNGDYRPLGIPTVVDRVAQQLITTELENEVEPHFSPNSYGYRPNKSAHQAVEQCRRNCLKSNWVIDLDIKGFFDNIDHELLLKAVKHYTDKAHILLYVKRWIEVAVELPDGTIKPTEGKGTPQGGVISPVLANIFMDIVFDKWIAKEYPDNSFERYADDIIVHCKHIKDALRLLEAIKKRLSACKLELNREKSKIVYCRRNQRRHPPFKVYYQEFDFLGFTFRPRMERRRGRMQLGFSPAMSQKSISRITSELFKMKIHRWLNSTLSSIGYELKLKIRGWLNYYGVYRKSEMRRLFRALNQRLYKWVRSKYKRFKNKHWYYSLKYLQKIAKDYPNMFEHWKYQGFRP